MAHANGHTNLAARRLIVERVAAGWPTAHVAEQAGILRATVYKWLLWFADGGAAVLVDRSSQPADAERTAPKTDNRCWRPATNVSVVRSCGGRTRVESLNGRAHPGPASGTAPATIDPITGAVIRGSSRHSPNPKEHTQPSALIHMGVKKLGKIPAGGYTAAPTHGRGEPAQEGRDRLRLHHTAIDDHTLLAYSKIHDKEKDPTCAAFLQCALSHGSAPTTSAPNAW